MFRRELKELFHLALPLAAAQAGTQVMGVFDVAVLGRFSALDMAAAGLGNALFFSISIIGMGMVIGVDPLISQALGAGDEVRARRVLWQGVWLALIVSGALTVPLVVSPLVLPIAGVQRDLMEPTTTYLLIRTTSLAPFLVFLVVRAYLQAHGRTGPMLTAMIVGNLVNISDILLVFGGGILPEWCGPLRSFPALGVAGAAISTVIGVFLQLWIVAAAVLKIPVPHASELHRWNGVEVRQAFQVGWPVGLQMGAEVGIFALVAVLAGRLGTLDLGAHQVVISLASFTFTVALGVAAAGSVRVGLAVGARNEMRTRVAGYAAFLGGAAVMGFSGLMFALFPRALGRILTDDPSVIAAAVPLFVVAAVFQLSDGVQAVGAGVLRGAGDTRYTFAVNILGHWFIGFPIALFLGFQRKMGIVGLWWGLCAGLTVVAVLLFLRFKRLSAQPIEPIQSLGLVITPPDEVQS